MKLIQAIIQFVDTLRAPAARAGQFKKTAYVKTPR